MNASTPHLRRHHPRKRMIQYSEPSVIEAKVRGVLDTAFAGYDGLSWSSTVPIGNHGIHFCRNPFPCPAPHHGLSLALPPGRTPDEHVKAA
jgi:hypothetical protein